MALSLDPSLRDLDACGCCEGVTTATPAVVYNRPGLSAISYRVGQWATFNASLLARLAATDKARLRSLATRESDDFTVALLDAWATTLDVLTFYSERIANESYLRTATERFSLLQLARAIGYRLRPGVAASTSLAFTIEEAPGAPNQAVGRTTIDSGTKVQSVPGPGEQAQVFETVEGIEARVAWNAMRPRLTRPQTLSAQAGELWLQGTATNLRVGDRLLILDGASGVALRRVSQVAPDDAAGRTRVTLEATDANTPPLSSQGITVSTSGPWGAPGVWGMRVKAGPFGHNAPQRSKVSPSTGEISYEKWIAAETPTQLTLDAVYDQIQQGSWVVIERPSSPSSANRIQRLCHAAVVQTLSRAEYGLGGRGTSLTLDAAWWGAGDTMCVVRRTTVFAQSERLAVAEAPILDAVTGGQIELGGAYPELVKGQSVVVSGQLDGTPSDSARGSELVTIASVATSSGFTTLTFDRGLRNRYKIETVRLNANVAAATHGETVREVLGSGNAALPYQQFTLRQAPLTYRRAGTVEGSRSTLQVRVNDVLWHEVASLLEAAPYDRVYITLADDEGRTTVEFGDGATGARPPSGTENIRATYRKGTGASGNVKAGQLSILMTRPLGVKEVVNPEAARGGLDAETRDAARQNAPLGVMTLGRVVSLRDYEDFARAFPGIGKALATWTWHGQGRGVFVTIAGAEGDELRETDRVFTDLVQAMRAAGDPYVSLRVKLHAPRIFKLRAVLTRDPVYEAEQVEREVRRALLDHFSFQRRQFGQPVTLGEVMAVIQRIPGVVGVDVRALYRPDLPGVDGLQRSLPAALPRPGSSGAVTPAELLTLGRSDIELGAT